MSTKTDDKVPTTLDRMSGREPRLPRGKLPEKPAAAEETDDDRIKGKVKKSQAS